MQGANPADGPAMAGDPYGSFESSYQLAMRALASNAATVTAVALSAYKTEHAQYPAQLADLVPDYLPALPADPITRQPMRYRLQKRHGFVVYSVGENAVDDGGLLWNEVPDQGKPKLDDVVFAPIRSDPEQEWFLVAADQSEHGSESNQSQPTQ